MERPASATATCEALPRCPGCATPCDGPHSSRGVHWPWPPLCLGGDRGAPRAVAALSKKRRMAERGGAPDEPPVCDCACPAVAVSAALSAASASASISIAWCCSPTCDAVCEAGSKPAVPAETSSACASSVAALASPSAPLEALSGWFRLSSAVLAFCLCVSAYSRISDRSSMLGTTTKELMGWLVSGDFAAIVIMYLLIASRSYVCPEPTAKTFGGRARRASACECR